MKVFGGFEMLQQLFFVFVLLLITSYQTLQLMSAPLQHPKINYFPQAIFFGVFVPLFLANHVFFLFLNLKSAVVRL